MVNGCNVVVQAGLGCRFVRENIKKQKIAGGLFALRVAARGPAAQGRVVILRLCGTAKAVP
jgi:hypothetical protein